MKARRSGSAMWSMRSSVKAWSTEPSSWMAGALRGVAEVEMGDDWTSCRGDRRDGATAALPWVRN